MFLLHIHIYNKKIIIPIDNGIIISYYIPMQQQLDNIMTEQPTTYTLSEPSKNLKLPAALVKQLKIIAAAKDSTIREIAIEAIESYLKQQGCLK